MIKLLLFTVSGILLLLGLIYNSVIYPWNYLMITIGGLLGGYYFVSATEYIGYLGYKLSKIL